MSNPKEPFLTAIVKTKFYPPLCLWCEHFHMYVGSPGYSEYTPGSDYDMYCNLSHWNYDRYASETHYRECILTAMHCEDFSVDPKIIREIQDVRPKPPKKGKRP